MTLMAGPIYTLISVKVPVWVRKAMEKIMKAFQWTGSDTVQGGKCLVAKPKSPAVVATRWLRHARHALHGHRTAGSLALAAAC
jgi:hypothetical protein